MEAYAEYCSTFGAVKAMVLAERAILNNQAKRPDVRRGRPDPPGSTLCDKFSIDKLRRVFDIPHDVKIIIPSSSDRIKSAPPGYFSMLESYFYESLLWLPLPDVFVDFLARYNLSLSQIPPNGIRHLVGIFVRGIECGIQVGVDFLSDVLSLRPTSKTRLTYAISAKRGLGIIRGLPGKVHYWDEHFFYVKIDHHSIEGGGFHRVRSQWDHKG